MRLRKDREVRRKYSDERFVWKCKTKNNRERKVKGERVIK